MNANIAAIAYIVSGILFILALRGLSSPTTSQAGNRNGMIGMAIAVGTALLTLWGQGALDALKALYGSLPDSPARGALKTLLDHHLKR